MRSTLTVRELEAFLQVAQLCNFRQAAQRFHVSQPALSRIIQSAEEKLGASLFDRNTRHVELTRSGQELLPIARRIVAEFHDSLSDLSEFVAGRKGQIKIACLPSAAALLPATMFEFEQSHPRVSISLMPISNEFVRDMVADGRADFGMSVAPAGLGQVEFERFARDDFVLICSRKDSLAKRRQVDWSVLGTRPIVASGLASSIRPMVDRVLVEAGVSIKPKYEATNISVVGAMVAAGLGVAPIPRLALRLIDMTELAVLKLGRPVLYREIGILTRNGRSLSAAATSFLDTLRSGEWPGTEQPYARPSSSGAALS